MICHPYRTEAAATGEKFNAALKAAFDEIVRQRPETIDFSHGEVRTAVLTFDAIDLRKIVAAVLKADGADEIEQLHRELADAKSRLSYHAD